MSDDSLLKHIQQSHQAIAKTVSDFGASVNQSNNEIIDLKRMMGDFIIRADKKLDDHDSSIKTLDEAKTTIFASLATTKLVAGVLLTIILSMGGFIIKTWGDRLDKIENGRQETLDKVFQLLESKKNYLNQEELKTIFANISQ